MNRIICALITMLFFLAPLQAAFPDHSDDYVNDYAGILSTDEFSLLRKELSHVEHQTGIEIVVVTLQSVDYYGYSSVERFATDLFNNWGVGHKKENNGIMILIALRDRKIRIETGGGYGRNLDNEMKDIITHDMSPYFKEGNYSQGIIEGARAVIKTVTRKVSFWEKNKWNILLFVLFIVCVCAGISCIKSGKTGWGWTFFTIAGIILIFLLKAMMSGRSRSGFGGGSSFGGGASGSW